MRILSFPPTFPIRNALFYLERWSGNSLNGILDNEEGLEDDNDVTTNTENESEPDFDDSDDDALDPILSADYDTADNNIDVD